MPSTASAASTKLWPATPPSSTTPPGNPCKRSSDAYRGRIRRTGSEPPRDADHRALLDHVELVAVDSLALHVIDRQRLVAKVAVEIDRGMRAEIEIVGRDRL